MPARVEQYLRAHPGFLAAHPELYAVLAPPTRVHGAVFADHMAAIIDAARAQAAGLRQQAEDVLANGRAAAGVAERVQAAVLAALAAADLVDCVTEVWPGLLGVDAAALCCETSHPRWRKLPRGAVRSLLADRPMTLRDRPADAMVLHAEAALLAERDVLVRVPGQRHALLALVSRHPAGLPNTQAYVFLGEVLGVLLSRD